MTAVVHRRISSTALFTSDRSATRRSHWSGFSARATSPPEIVLRVVSLPATSSWLRNMASSSSVRRSPSTSTLASCPMTSSFGCDPGLADEAHQLAHHLGAELLLAHRVVEDLGAGDRRLGPVPDLVPLLLGEAEQLGDHLDRAAGRRAAARCRPARRGGGPRPAPSPRRGSPRRASSPLAARTPAARATGTGCGRAGRCASSSAGWRTAAPISKVRMPRPDS